MAPKKKLDRRRIRSKVIIISKQSGVEILSKVKVERNNVSGIDGVRKATLYWSSRNARI